MSSVLGERVDVIGTSKGKGFAGVVKRYHFKGRFDDPWRLGSYSCSRFERSSTTTPGRVYKGSRRAGHMGKRTCHRPGSEGRPGGCRTQPYWRSWCCPRPQRRPGHDSGRAQAVGAEDGSTGTMKVDVLNMKGEKVKTVELPAEIFEAHVNIDLMHQAYIQQMANARLGTHKTKTRSEVSGGGKKPWKQKGTGRARAGFHACPELGSWRQDPHPAPAQVHPAHADQDAPRCPTLRPLGQGSRGRLWSWSMNLILAEPKTRLMAQALNTLVGEVERPGAGRREGCHLRNGRPLDQQSSGCQAADGELPEYPRSAWL